MGQSCKRVAARAKKARSIRCDARSRTLASMKNRVTPGLPMEMAEQQVLALAKEERAMLGPAMEALLAVEAQPEAPTISRISTRVASMLSAPKGSLPFTSTALPEKQGRCSALVVSLATKIPKCAPPAVPASPSPTGQAPSATCSSKRRAELCRRGVSSSAAFALKTHSRHGRPRSDRPQ